MHLVKGYFSKANFVKTNLRNRMATHALSSVILAAEHVKDFGGCNKFKPSQKMISCMTKANLYIKTKKLQHLKII